MTDALIIICILSGLALSANVAVCLYTLYLAKKLEHAKFLEGYAKAIVERELSEDKENFKPECSD